MRDRQIYSSSQNNRSKSCGKTLQGLTRPDFAKTIDN
jgi:hypothetical protein